MRSAYIVSVVCYKVARLRKPGKYLQLETKLQLKLKFVVLVLLVIYQ